jgi:hypothetical protein
VIATPPAATATAVARTAAWLDTMRATAPGAPSGGAPGVPTVGYGGPVVHWWRDSLRFCGPGYDWRYEGIILGYLSLYRRSRREWWLERARRAGDDLLAAQLPAGHFGNSGFELNPVTRGTPHEAAADAGLLALAAELKEAGDPAWSSYLEGARRNLTRFHVARLWHEETGRFCDDEAHASFVPNKAATVAEALFALADLTGDDVWGERYARPTLEAVLRCQLRRPGHPLDGAIAQSSARGATAEKYFPFYVARCVPALVEAARRYRDPRYLEGALAAGAFVHRWREPDGAFPQVVYPDGRGARVNRYPRWVGGIGDVLRALELLRPHGLDVDVAPSRRWLLDRQLASGSFRPAEGFASQSSQRPPPALPDVRDLLPVVGWADKAFRYLAGDADLPDDLPGAAAEAAGASPATSVELPCLFRGRPAVFREDGAAVEVTAAGGSRSVLYRWLKGESWATTDPLPGAGRGETA